MSASGTTAAASERGQLRAAFAMLRVPAWVAACYAILRTNADPDLWGHVQFGLDLLRSRELPSTDPYSFTSDIPWTNHEWLSELIAGAAYFSMGSSGLIVLKVVLTVATLAVLAMSLKHASEPWRWLSGFLVVLAIKPIAITVRPHLWTLLFLVVLCRIVSGPARRRLWLPPMFLLWVNLHGGWIVGFGVLALWSFMELLEPKSKRASLWLVIGVPFLCVIATLGNPYGWHLWEFLAGTVRLSRSDITEWQPIWRDSIGAVLLWMAGVAWVGMAIRHAENKSTKVLAVVAALAFGSLRVNRLLPLFIPTAIVLLTPFIRDPRSSERQEWPKGRTLMDVAIACIGILILMWPTSPGCIQMRGSWLPDVGAANALAAARPVGRAVTWFDWGEYVIWHLGPELKVSMDGRRETVYSDTVRQRQAGIAFGDPSVFEDLERTSPEYVWLPMARSARTRNWLLSHGYRIDVETADSFVAVRGDLPSVPPVAQAATGCFPDGPRY